MAQKVTVDRMCEWDCGSNAEYYFPYSKRYCCCDNPSRCRGKIAKTVQFRKENGSYKQGAAKSLATKRTTMLPNGKTILQQAGENTKRTITAINSDGTSIAAERAAKMVATRRATIDPVTGLDLCQLSGKKQKETKNRIDEVTGLTIHKLAGQKGLATKRQKDENDEDWFDRVKPGLKKKAAANGKRLHKERIADIDETGLDHYARRTKKMIADVDETGLDGFARADKNKRKRNAKKHYKNSDIHYQCSYEFKWLTALEERYGADWVLSNVKNGATFQYFNPVSNAIRYYFSDFMIGNTIYEIKSSYTWNRLGKDLALESVNKAKLQAVKDSGYNAILVLDHKEYIQ